MERREGVMISGEIMAAFRERKTEIVEEGEMRCPSQVLVDLQLVCSISNILTKKCIECLTRHIWMPFNIGYLSRMCGDKNYMAYLGDRYLHVH